MRKRLSALALVATMMLGGGVGLAPEVSAAPAPQANCVAESVAMAHEMFGGRGFAALVVVPDAHDGGAGEFIAPRAKNDFCPAPAGT